MKSLKLSCALCATMTLSANSAVAQGDEWRYEVSPYLWGSGLDGTVATIPDAPSARVDLEFSDIVEELQFGAMVAGTARKGKWGIMGDLQYIRLGDDFSTRTRLFDDGDYEIRMTVLTFGGEYLVSDGPQGEFRLVGAARRWQVTTEIDLNAGLAAARDISESNSWWDAMVGVRGRYDLGPKTYIAGTALVGGGGSDFTNDIFAGIGYKLSDTSSLVGGYRYVSVDREDGDFIYDIEQQGVMVGFTFAFD